jgi:TrpR-related protein YerC/YecD
MSTGNSIKTNDLYKAILALKGLGEAKSFFRDLLTEREIIEFSNRWQAARLLDEGVIYPKIQAQTGLSTRTIARISRWLKKGKGGYRLMLNRLNHHRSSLFSKKS